MQEEYEVEGEWSKATLKESKSGILVSIDSQIQGDITDAVVLLKFKPEMDFDEMYNECTEYSQYLVQCAEDVLRSGAGQLSKIIRKGFVVE